MNIGISTASLCTRRETEESISAIKKLGAMYCDIYLQTFYEYRPEFAKKYAPCAEGMTVNSVRVSPANFEVQLFAERRRARGDGFYWLDQVLRSARLFGAEKYTFRGLSPCAGYENADYSADRLNEIITFCERYGTGFCLENSRSGLFGSPKIYGELKARVPRLSGALSLGEAEASGYPWQMYAAVMRGSISHVFIPAHWTARAEEIFKRLKDEGFDGSVFIDAGDFCEISRLKRALELSEEIIYKLT